MVERTLPGHIRKLFELAAAADGPRVIDSWATVFNRAVNESGLLDAITSIAFGLDQLDAAVAESGHDEALKTQCSQNIYRLRQFVSFPLLYEGTPKSLRDPHVSASISNIILLEAVAGEPLNRVLPSTTVKDFQEKIASLLEDLDNLMLPPQVKAIIREALGRVFWALTSYELIGIEGLSRIFGSAMSEVLRTAPVASKSPEGRAFLGRLISAGKAIGAVIIAVGGFAQGANTITDASALAIEYLQTD